MIFILRRKNVDILHQTMTLHWNDAHHFWPISFGQFLIREFIVFTFRSHLNSCTFSLFQTSISAYFTVGIQTVDADRV